MQTSTHEYEYCQEVDNVCESLGVVRNRIHSGRPYVGFVDQTREQVVSRLLSEGMWLVGTWTRPTVHNTSQLVSVLESHEGGMFRVYRVGRILFVEPEVEPEVEQ